MEEEYRKAFSEVLEVLNHVDKKLTNKIPRKFKLFLEENADKTHVIELDNKKSLHEQEISNLSKAIIAMVYKEYIKKENNEKADLEQNLKNNITFPYKSEDLEIKLEEKNTENMLTKKKTNKFVELLKKLFKKRNDGE